MFAVSYLIALISGLISFFAPCVAPLLPAYIGYVTGVSLQDLKTKGYGFYKRRLLISSVFYILGFSMVFVVLGTAAASLGVVLRRHDEIIQRVGGFVILVFGLEFAGILKIPFLAKQRQLDLPNWGKRLGHLRSFFVGLIFATAWTPCVGAVLGSILALAAVSGTLLKGATLLFVYSLGISIPFMVVSLTLASAPRYLPSINRYIGPISKVAGGILAVLGLLLLTDSYKYLNSWLFEIAFRWGYKIK